MAFMVSGAACLAAAALMLFVKAPSTKN